VDGAGLYHGVQTLRQLLPPAGATASGATAAGAGTVPAVTVVDRPRYGYRSGLLDVARHFFTVPVVEDYIDLLAQYKYNYLRLHLSDDQGWRIAVPGLPALTGIGASTEVGGSGGGFYTEDDYRAIVAYAAAHYITVIPEVDVPGHSNAALTAYPDLGCAGDTPAKPYTGTDVGFSRLCTGKESTYTFVDKVITALAAITPGPYLGVGGDEAKTLAPADYAAFMARASGIVRAHGKQPLAWDEAVTAGSAGPALLGVWHPVSQQDPATTAQLVAAAGRGVKLVLEPADRAYLDQKYDASTALGLHWAGYLDVRKSYEWNPDTYLPGVPAGGVIGVEAALWTETLATEKDLQTMLLPRLPALAEVGWTAQSSRSWSDFRQRLAAQAPYWTAQHLAFTRADGVDWN
jgi:hexosaminidase